jgi:citrate lyase beta subunit
MKHHAYNPDFTFVKAPMEFNKNAPREILRYCLGGTLYMPGTKDIKQKVLEQKLDVTSLVLDCEDALQEDNLSAAERNIQDHLDFFADKISEGVITIDDIPLIFIRIRNEEHFEHLAGILTPKQASVLTGFNFPKFNSKTAFRLLNTLVQLSNRLGVHLYGMPILEGPEIAFREERKQELLLLRNILEPYQKYILNVRVGGTDMSSLFGVRRGMNTSIYDIMPVRDALSEILNFFGRLNDYVVSAAVWEYFLAYKEDDISELIQQRFYHSLVHGKAIVNPAIDGLLREVMLDKVNGFVGKTIIHPSHARFVNAMYCVVEEEYNDALQILKTDDGVVKSAMSNKMNEVRTHTSWAQKIVACANVYGVVKNEDSIIRLVLGHKK